jgi:hypothetical protein
VFAVYVRSWAAGIAEKHHPLQKSYGCTAFVTQFVVFFDAFGTSLSYNLAA